MVEEDAPPRFQQLEAGGEVRSQVGPQLSGHPAVHDPFADLGEMVCQDVRDHRREEPDLEQQARGHQRGRREQQRRHVGESPAREPSMGPGGEQRGEAGRSQQPQRGGREHPRPERQQRHERDEGEAQEEEEDEVDPRDARPDPPEQFVRGQERRGVRRRHSEQSGHHQACRR